MPTNQPHHTKMKQSFNERLVDAVKAHPNHKFLQSIASQLINGRTLSQAQFTAINDVLDRFDESEVLLANTPPLTTNPNPQQFAGVIQSIRDVEGKFGTRTKMIVRLIDGNTVYSTVPRALNKRATKGAHVTFSGTLTVSNDDPHFGFVKFPTATATATSTI
jgi:hypothetical protein